MRRATRTSSNLPTAPRSSTNLPTAPRSSTIRLVTCVVVIAATASCKGCGKKETDPISAPAPVMGAATQAELTTPLGPARGLDESMAPTSTKWRRAFVLDDKRVTFVGETTNETIALITEDAGAHFRSLRMGKEGWANWNVADDGTLALAVGQRGGAKAPNEGALDSVKFTFAPKDATALGPLQVLFPPAKGPLKGKLISDTAIPAIVAPKYAAVFAENAKKKSALFFGGRPGTEPVPELALPNGEKLAPVPYGRPASFFSIKGKDVFIRPFPEPGKPFAKPEKVPKLAATPALLADLSAPPICEFGELSFQRIKVGDAVSLLAIGGGKVTQIPLPATTPPTTSVGCNATHVVVEAANAKAQLILVKCDFDGKCTEPQNTPFRPWLEKHEQKIITALTEKGFLAVLQQRIGDRWGLYVGQTNDGVLFEQPRVVGEGNSDRGRIELGAFVALGERLLLVVSSDLTGSARRGWYTTSTDDLGLNWGAP